jgi:predicted TIM-barrel fold metal-dependent hydrolase
VTSPKPAPLIDAHAHFLHEGCGRTDWREVNAARFRAGAKMGIDCHVASVLGTYGHGSPTYFPSPADVTLGNDAMLGICAEHGDLVRMMVTVNPNHTAHAVDEIERCVAKGAIGVKLLASRRADDALLDPICELAAKRKLAVLHHIWQHRTRDWHNQEISDGADLGVLAKRHPNVTFILAHIGGGGNYRHTFEVCRDVKNIVADISGSGVDRGMLDGAIESFGAQRLLFATDLTMETGLAKLRALEPTGLLSADDLEDIRWRNCVRIFRDGAFAVS